MKKIYLLAICLAGVLLTSCSSVRVFSYEQLMPSVVNYPESVRKVGIVNNLPAGQSPANDKLTIGEVQADGKIAAEAFAEAVANASYFDETLISDSVVNTGSGMGKMQTLSTMQVKDLTAAMGVDMLFSLDDFEVVTSRKVIMDWELGQVEVLSADVKPLVHVYLPGKDGPLYAVSKSDSLYFYLTRTLSDRSVVEGVSKNAVLPLADYLLPHWRNAERCYFDGGSVEMRDAGVWAREGEWAEARNLWQNLYDKAGKNSRKKMRAAFNIALSYEMEGAPDKGLEWLKKAENLNITDVKDLEILKWYTKELTQRTEELNKLGVQMLRFNKNF